jgi:hypothetical protein
MKRSVVIKRLGYEASAGWTTYGTSLAAFSSLQGVATRHVELLRKRTRPQAQRGTRGPQEDRPSLFSND